MVSEGAIDGIEIDPSSSIQSCDSCKYAKATHKPIQKSHEVPRASNFGDKIHSDVWGPSPIQTPGHKEFYMSFTDNYTQWTYLELLASKDKMFEAYKDFEMWARFHHGIPAIKTLHSD